MFWFGSGCGKDYVTGFTIGNEETSDILNIYTAGLNSITRSNGIVTIKMNDKASLELNAGTDINGINRESTLTQPLGFRLACHCHIGQCDCIFRQAVFFIRRLGANVQR